MNKFFRAIACMLIITLVTGTIPVMAATSGLSLNRKTKVLYIGGAKGIAEDGTKATTKSRYNVTKAINGYDKNTMYVKLRAENTSIVRTKNSKSKIYARKTVGSTKVYISVYNRKDKKLIDTLTLKVRVRKNAESIRYAVKDKTGKTIDLYDSILGINTTYSVVVSNKDANGIKMDTDKRRLIADDDSVQVKKANRRSTKYKVTFTKTGAYILTAEAYQDSDYTETLLTEDICIRVSEQESLVYEDDTQTDVYCEVKFGMPDGVSKADKDKITLPETKMIKKGTYIEGLSMASMTGKMFLGWYYDPALTKMVGPNDIIDRNLTLYPRFGSREGLDGTFSYDYVAKEDVDADYTVLVAAHNLSENEVKNLIQVRDKTTGDEVIDFNIEPYNKSVKGLENTFKAYSVLFNNDTLDLLKKVGVDLTFTGMIDLNKKYGLGSDDSPARYWRETLKLEPDDVLLLQDTVEKIKENAWNNITIYRVTPKSGKWTESHLQQVEITDTSCLRYVFEGAETEAAIKYNNFSVYKKEYNNLSLSKSMVFIPISETEGIDTLEGLLTFKADGDDHDVSANDIKGIIKTKENLEVGTNIAVYDGKLGENGVVDGNVGYFNITKVLGNGRYEYQSAEFMDVFKFPNIIPVKYNNNAKNGTVKLSSKELVFKGAIYDELKLNESTNIEAGDYIYFYSGSMPSSLEALASQVKDIAKIEKVTKNNDGISIDYVQSSLEELHSSSGMYQKVENIDIPVTKENEEAIRTVLETQMEEGDIAQKTSDYIMDLINGDIAGTDDPELDEALRNMTFKTDTGEDISIEALRQLTSGKKVEVTNKNAGFTLSPTLKHFKGEGMRAVASAGLTIKIHLNENNIIEIQCIIQLEQEIMLGFTTSVDVKWEVIPVDAIIDASLRAGTYTGFGAQATVITKSENPNEDTEWSRLLETTGAKGIDKSVENQLLDMGTKLGKMSKDLGKIQEGATQSKDGFQTTDDYDGAKPTTMGGDLPTKYAEMLGNDAEYVNLVDKELFRWEIGIDPWQVIKFSIAANFVVGFKLNAMIGFSITYGNAKQYCYHVQIKKKIAKSTTADIEAPNFRIDFFVFGMVGIRAGIKLDVRLGLLSTKFASIGLTAEAGLYAELYGFLYVNYAWRSGEGSTSGVMGSLLFEIGAYLEINFEAQLGDGKLDYTYTIYENKWPFLQLGATEVPVPHTYDPDDYQELQEVLEVPKGKSTIKVPDSVFGVDMMALDSGEVSRENMDSKVVGKESYSFEINGRSYTQYSEEHFDVTCYDLDGEDGEIIKDKNAHSFQYLPATNEIYVKPARNDEDEFWGLVTFTYHNEAFGFSTVEIKRTLKVHWKGDLAIGIVEYYLQNDTEDGYTLAKTGEFTGFDGIEYDLVIDRDFAYQFEGYCLTGVNYPGILDLQDLEIKLYNQMKAAAEKSKKDRTKESEKKWIKASDKWKKVFDRRESYYKNIKDTLSNKQGTMYFVMVKNETTVRLYFDKDAKHEVRPIIVYNNPPTGSGYQRGSTIIRNTEKVLDSLNKCEESFLKDYPYYSFEWYMVPVSGLQMKGTVSKGYGKNTVVYPVDEYRDIYNSEIDGILKAYDKWQLVTEDTKMPDEGVAFIAYAKADVPAFTVTWKDENGNILRQDKMKLGEEVYNPPQVSAPIRDGYKYGLGWADDTGYIYSVNFGRTYKDRTFTAQWKEYAEMQYITWLVDGESWTVEAGNTDDIVSLEDGRILAYRGSHTTRLGSIEKEGHTMKIYIVDGDILTEAPTELNIPAGGITLKAVYDIQSYDVTWKDGDKIIKKENLEYGTVLTPPEVTLGEDEDVVWLLDGEAISSDSKVPGKGIVLETSRHKHIWTFSRVLKFADCSNTGTEEYSCSICGKTKTKELPVEPDTHSWEVVSVTPGDCITIECTHYICKNCGELYDVNTGDINPDNHKEGCVIHKDRIEPGCLDVGYEEGEYCTACNKYISGGEVIPALEHDYGDEYEKRAATCLEGAIYAKKCSRCGDEIITAYTDPIAHDWDEIEYTWATDNSEVTAKRVCKTDPSHIEEETAKAELVDEKNPTCEVEGYKIYRAKFNNPDFGVAENSVTIKETGHMWVNFNYEWADDNSSVKATCECAINPNHKLEEVAETETKTIKAPSADEPGEIQIIAKFENPVFKCSKKETVYLANADTPVLSGLPDDGNVISYDLNEEADPLSVTATVNDGGVLTYQWYCCSDETINNANPNFAIIANANSSSFTPYTDYSGSYIYYVEVTNTKGGAKASTKSNYIYITVISNLVDITFKVIEGKIDTGNEDDNITEITYNNLETGDYHEAP